MNWVLLVIFFGIAVASVSLAASAKFKDRQWVYYCLPITFLIGCLGAGYQLALWFIFLGR